MSDIRTEITKLYIATFNRAPDSLGLNYWAGKIENDNWTIEMVAQSFFDQPETQTLYSSGSATRSFVESVYNNVLQRDADTDGLNYWVNNIDSGTLGRHELIVAMINAVNAGSSAEDLALLSNRANVGAAFADAGLDNVTLAREVLVGVTGDQGTIDQANQKIQDYLVNYSGQTSELFEAGGTLNLDFSLSGTSGQDTLNISLNNSSTPVIQSFENDDTIRIHAETLDSKAVLLGGSGDDTYQLGETGAYVVYDASGNDTLIINSSFDDLYALTVNNNQDLVLFDDFSGVLLPDWQNSTNRIETFKLDNATYNYQDLVNAVSTYTLGDFADSILDQFQDTTNFPGSELDRHIELFEFLGNMENSLAETISPTELSGLINSNNLADFLL